MGEMMQRIRRWWRLSRLFVHIVVGISLTALLTGVLRFSVEQAFFQRLITWWLRKVPQILGAQVQIFGQPAGRGVLMVANHISWLDIPLLGGATCLRFLSKKEVRHWPIIGWLADKSGTLFIERGKAGAAVEASQTILQALRTEHAVLLFPEGTTTKGEDVRTFHARLFAPAFDAQVPVQPVAIRYPAMAGTGLTNPIVPYVDEQSLGDNLQGLLGERCIAVEIHFLPPITTEGMERKRVAAHCEQQIRAILKHESLE
jgi:1-acyl-sn-glycerol-3-phosphate acyltransferase